MEQIFHFDNYDPPPLGEAVLKAKLEQRKTKKQTILLALSGAMLYWCMIITAVILYPLNAVFSIVCIAYACVAMCGGGVVTLIFADKRRSYSWQLWQ